MTELKKIYGVMGFSLLDTFIKRAELKTNCLEIEVLGPDGFDNSVILFGDKNRAALLREYRKQGFEELKDMPATAYFMGTQLIGIRPKEK